MRDKIFITIIVVLILALFVESAYLLQIKSDKQKISIAKPYSNHSFSKRFYKKDLLTPDLELRMEDPLKEINRIKKEFDKIFQDRSTLDKNVYETEREYLVKIVLPNMERSKINIEIKGNSLTISGGKNSVKKTMIGELYSTRQNFSSFQRVIPLPGNVKEHEAKTEYRDNILTIILPKDTTHAILKENPLKPKG